MNPLAGVSNPFRHTVVTDPWHPAESDVPTIHARAFESCRKGLEAVRTEGRSTSILLHGEAGSGKTHLLARLRALWTTPDTAESGSDAPRIVFIAVRLQTGPRRLWRYLRRSFADDLLRPSSDGSTQLRRVLLHRFAEIRPAAGDLELWWQWLKEEYPNPIDLERTIAELFERLDPDGQLSRDLCKVLTHLLLERQRRDARAWLLGDPLPEEVLRALNLGTDDEDDDDTQEDKARRTVVALCHLAGPNIPVVLCFDQVEALQVHPQDEAGLFAFGQLIMSLYQQTSNVLLISCIQSSFLDRLKASVRGAAWDRMSARQSSLDPLRWDEAKSLIASRMDSHPELARARKAHGGGLWPLDEVMLKHEVGATGCTARRILATCAELFEGVAGGATPPATSAEQFLTKTWQEHLELAAAASSADQADQILSHGLPLMADCLGQQWVPAAGDPLRDIDLLVESASGRIGVSLCNQPAKARGLVDKLRRLSAHFQPGKLEKLVLIRDVRLPIGRGPKTGEYLTQLTSQGARFVRPSAEAMRALQALRTLLSDAKAGDLAHNGKPLEPKTVQDWLAAHLPRDLRELVDEVVSASPVSAVQNTENQLIDALQELLEDRHVLPLAEAATCLGHPVDALEECIRRHSGQFGVLSGRQTVVFQFTPEPIEVEQGADA